MASTENKNKTKKISVFDGMKGILRASDMKQTKYKLAYAAMVLIMLVYLAVVIVPSLWMLLSGFKDASEIYQRPTRFFPREIRLSKVAEVWKELKFYKFYINTFALALGAVAFDVVVNGFAGYVLSRLKPRGSKAIYWLVMLLMMLPSTMTTVPLYKTFINFPIVHANMLNTYMPMWLMAAANMFNIVLFKTAFDGISSSLVEAARIDGATDMGIFFKIILPLSVPVIMTVCIFTFNGQFGNFFWPYLVVQEREKWTIGIWLYKVTGGTTPIDEQMLSILFSIAPQLLIFILFNKYIIGGINIGGVKG